MTPDDLAMRLRSSAATAGVRLLVLHGSRARRDDGAASDWDFGVLTDGTADLAALVTELTSALRTEAVDLVELERASALLRYRAARDGVVVLETDADAFQQFQLDAVGFWCDAGPVIRSAQDDVLAALG